MKKISLLRDTMVNAGTQLNLVIGYPLQHTKSPLLHTTIYRHLHCNAVMLAHATNNLSETMNAAKTLSVALMAVTMPYKKEIINYLGDVSEEAKKLNSVNTVISRDDKLFGYNTDVDGVAYALRNISLANKNTLIIGAGGASHAAAYFLNKQNANLWWLNRTEHHVLPLITKFGGNQVDKTKINEFPIDIIINTTPLGMFPDVHQSPLPNYSFNANQIVFDMVYNPIDTLLIKNAREKGAECISGIDMLIGQGIKQIELWLNKPVDISIDHIKKILN
ncbi:MAG: shikimate 5-dehydrogenase I alpha [uncultured bacterium]|nr:MAG: shikimate 5-dehydrogenase I alpha [uncultured bacterium]OGT26623.1 MAG: shikimate dehydrogenase [Gammaproteobacteria bacterium RIFCSPHIGHO2_02_FULL_42_43]OGT29388.1 MAG: shikimate dehydrogenase [Gammaproteobacteria bacterium RIFCSPHIGHO2_01_FULL_42_8]OGT52473.1 MAG: shikimate dehydrogenase [Gammaproteobacteria bacterium RIFCSPHIGHO2_12_FULL_41_25]OGT61155.1 MAG: shikimate dehydrogenase [Gammaproteobacteria bacterium RIFCSPLOWO2_02_FULL_42_14]OGT87083.1 MAG: shikimate dehydrogenase [Gam